MKAILFTDNIVKSLTKGEVLSSQIEPLEELVAFDFKDNILKLIKVIRIENIESNHAFQFQFMSGHTIVLSSELYVYTIYGPKIVREIPVNFYSFCIFNPSKLSIKEYTHTVEVSHNQRAVCVYWDDPYYLWVNGVLVGSE